MHQAQWGAVLPFALASEIDRILNTQKEVTHVKITIRKLERIETTAISAGGCCGCYDC